MCGIFGDIDLERGVDSDWLRACSRLLEHRGPDSRGFWKSGCGRAGLGHTRLAIVDLTVGSNQPMVSAEGCVIVFNGEIYNHQELRKQLILLGHQFRTSGDTEVALRAYVEWGYDCVNRFNGMFSLAIFDERKNVHGSPILFFARDRVGEKPFYYSSSEKSFRFASEVKGFGTGKKISTLALNYYLRLGYVPADHCLFDGVKKLKPAHCGIYSFEYKNTRIWRYWDVPIQEVDQSWSIQDAKEEIKELLLDAVKLRLQADVPFGVLLSGGLDSTLIAAAAAKVSNGAVKTFTVALPGERIDEGVRAKEISGLLGTEHTELRMDGSDLTLLDEISDWIDEPIADSSLLPCAALFKATSQKVKMALGGDGGDELFGGYDDYKVSIRESEQFGLIPKKAYRLAAIAAERLPSGIRGRNKVVSLQAGPLEQMLWSTPYFDQYSRRRLLEDASRYEIAESWLEPELTLKRLYMSGAGPIDKMTRTHFGGSLVDDYLVKIDRTSMMSGIEIRCPFLDSRLIEICFGKIRDEWKVRDGESRRLQRMILGDWLPSLSLNTKKQGFSIPVNDWLRKESETDLMKRLDGLPKQINMDEVVSIVRGHKNGRANGGRLFALLMLAKSSRNA